MGTLYLIATPIGNLGDLSPRALEILEQSDLIAAEDTRVTGSLLKKLGISKKLVSYYEHNASMRSSLLLSHLENGEMFIIFFAKVTEIPKNLTKVEGIATERKPCRL
jgi:16S rRNA C1402 (ribose-2'-O) methylase RsmI